MHMQLLNSRLCSTSSSLSRLQKARLFVWRANRERKCFAMTGRRHATWFDESCKCVQKHSHSNFSLLAQDRLINEGFRKIRISHQNKLQRNVWKNSIYNSCQEFRFIKKRLNDNFSALATHSQHKTAIKYLFAGNQICINTKDHSVLLPINKSKIISAASSALTKK
jgi:hypothetical protein